MEPLTFRAKWGGTLPSALMIRRYLREGTFKSQRKSNRGSWAGTSHAPSSPGWSEEPNRHGGPWELEWIKLSRADVTNVLCTAGEQGKPAQPTSSETGSTTRNRPAFERALGAIKELYPRGVPEKATEPNANLCRRVGDKLKNEGLPDVSDDTILRAA